MSSDDEQQHQWGVVFPDTLGTKQQELRPHNQAGVVAYLLAELGEEVSMRQQLKPRRQKLPDTQHSECQAHHDAQQSGLCPRRVTFSQVVIKRTTNCCSEFIIINL